MTTVFQSTSCIPDSDADFLTAEAAAAHVEANGPHGSVTKFIVRPNLPGCLPAQVYSSCALWVYENGVWNAIGIFGGDGASLGEERPGSNAVELRRQAANPFVVEVHVTSYGQDFWNVGHERFALRADAEAEAEAGRRCTNGEWRVRDTRVAASA